MLRIIFNENQIISILDNDPNTGITYTIERVIICTKEEALNFFRDYPEEELIKIEEYVK